MPQTVELPNGDTAEFPDGMDPEKMASAIRDKFGDQRKWPKPIDPSINPIAQGFTIPMVEPQAIQTAREQRPKAELEKMGLTPSDLPSPRSLIDLPRPEDIPSGVGSPVPTLTIPLSAAARTAAGAGQYLTSPQGLRELATAAIPGPDILQFGKWAYDMIHGAKMSIEDARGALRNMIGHFIDQQFQKARGVTPDPKQIQEDAQQLTEDALNTVVMGVGGLGAGRAAIGRTAGLLPVTEAARPVTPIIPSIKSDKPAIEATPEQVAEMNKGVTDASIHQERGEVHAPVPIQPGEGQQAVPSEVSGEGVQPLPPTPTAPPEETAEQPVVAEKEAKPEGWSDERWAIFKKQRLAAEEVARQREAEFIPPTKSLKPLSEIDAPPKPELAPDTARILSEKERRRAELEKRRAPLPGYDTLPQKTKDVFEKAWQERDPVQMGLLLDPRNKNLRQEWENRTGEQLPKQIGKTHEKVRNYFLFNPKALEEVAPVTKAQNEVRQVAAKEGQRPAKEVKEGIITNIEEAVSKAPEERDLFDNVQVVNGQVKKRGKTTDKDYGLSLSSTLADLDRKNKPESRTRASELRAQALKLVGKQVTIDIPGDGTFKVWNTKEALAEMLKRTKRVKTDAGKLPIKEIPSEELKSGSDAAVKAYGGLHPAIARISGLVEGLSDEHPDKNTYQIILSTLRAQADAIREKYQRGYDNADQSLKDADRKISELRADEKNLGRFERQQLKELIGKRIFLEKNVQEARTALSGDIDKQIAAERAVEGLKSKEFTESEPKQDFRERLREKQDRVLEIIRRRNLPTDLPFTDLQRGAPTAEQLRSQIWPDFESSLDRFIEENKEVTVSKPKGIAASVRNKWTSATEGPLGSEAGFFTLGPLKDLLDNVGPAVRASVAYLKGLKEEQLRLPRMTDYRRSVLNWTGKLEKSFGQAQSAQREIRSKVKNPIRQDGITNWIQADGDQSILQQRLAATQSWSDPVTGKPHPQQKRLIAGYEAALNLTPEEIAVANEIKIAFDDLGARAQQYDVLHTFKDNYVTQIWNLGRGPTGGFGGAGGRTLRDKFRFSRASTFPTYFDGEQAGFVPKTKEISRILPVYIHEMNQVIANRQLVEQMSKGKASDGRPLLWFRGGATEIPQPQGGQTTLVFPDVTREGRSQNAALNERGDYVELPNQPALHRWQMVSGFGTDRPIYMKGDLVVHPEAAKHLKNVLGRSAISEWYRSDGTLLAAVPKKIVHGLDFAQAEVKNSMLGVLSPFHQVQEGTHAVWHRVNPSFNNPTIDLVNNREQMDAANHGLMLLPDRTSSQQFMDGFRRSHLVGLVPGIREAAEYYSHYLFHEYIPGIKFKTYQVILDRNTRVFAKELTSGENKLEDVKTLSAEQANAAFGHLNYADLGRNPTILHLMRLGLIAPDFLEARMRFAGQALKGLTGAKVGREQIIALATGAVAQATLAYIFAKMTGGQWDKDNPFTFHVGNRRYTMRSVPEDIYRAVKDPRTFWSARLNPLTARMPVELISGTDWRGRKVTAGETLTEAVKQPVPLMLRPLLHSANTPLSGWEQIMDASGLKVSRYSAQSELRKRAHDWMAKSGDPKLVAAEERYRKETFPDSDYKPLREALINDDLKTAQKEYAKLRQTRTPEVISKTMTHSRPFTLSANTDSKFRKSLSGQDQLLWDAAKKEQDDLKKKFLDMRRKSSQTIP